MKDHKKQEPQQLRPVPSQDAAQQYDLNEQERSSLALILGKLELADTSAKLAQEMKQSADLLKQQWLQQLIVRRGLPPDSKVQVDAANAKLFITPAPVQEKSP